MPATRSPAGIVPYLATFFICLLLSTAAWSQYGGDRGQWQILQARYGTAEHSLDVTQRLRDLARQDTTFRVSNKTFQNDPAPGVVKTLRIYARGPSGSTRTFEYIEDDIVDGNQFTSWSSGNWGQGGWEGGWGNAPEDDHGDRGRWQILQARYGTGYRNMDVTQQLRELARQDNAFRVTNKLFGRDPDPGVVKTLRIYARGPNGATRTFEYGEEQMVDGALFTGWSGGNWGQGNWSGGWGHDSGSEAPPGGVRIVSAQYGEGHNRLDVTSRLRSMVRDGRISIRVDNRTMGSDPAVGRPKILWVTYYVGGHGQRELKVYENEQLMLP